MTAKESAETASRKEYFRLRNLPENLRKTDAEVAVMVNNHAKGGMR